MAPLVPGDGGCVRYPQEMLCPICGINASETLNEVVDDVQREIYVCCNGHSWLKPLPLRRQPNIPSGSYFRLDQLGP